MDDLYELHQLCELEELAELAEMIPVGRRVTDRMNPFHVYNDDQFVARYRLSKECIITLLESIRPRLPKVRNQRGTPIPPHLQLLVTLRYLATGNFEMSMANCSNISQPSVSRCIRSISARLAELASEFMRLPEPGKEESTMHQFSTIAGMPGVIGCIDATHILIKSPGGKDAELYCYRKNCFALNVQGICDASLKFTNMISDWPGTVPDSLIFCESGIYEKLQSNTYKGFLLGDNKYTCQSFLLTPFECPSTDKEEKYNAAHTKTWSSIKKAFKLLKKRFAVLSRPIRTKLETSKRIILACAMLHNLAITSRTPFEDLPDDAQATSSTVSLECQRDSIQDGLLLRSHVVEKYFSE